MLYVIWFMMTRKFHSSDTEMPTMKPYLCSTWKTSHTWSTCCLKAQHLSTKKIRFSPLFELINVFIRLRNIILKKCFLFIWINWQADKLHLQLPCRQQSVKVTLFNVLTGSRVKQQYLQTTRHQDDVCLGPCTSVQLFDFRKEKTTIFSIFRFKIWNRKMVIDSLTDCGWCADEWKLGITNSDFVLFFISDFAVGLF